VIVLRYLRTIMAATRKESCIAGEKLVAPFDAAHLGGKIHGDVGGVPQTSQPVGARLQEGSELLRQHGSELVTRTYRVIVLLNQGEVFAHPGDGYEPLSGHVKAIEFSIDAVSSTAACEIAYAVANSYPMDLHCEPKYLDIVRTYREVGHFRSAAFGDIFEVDEERFVCARFGFSKLPA
jgi:hypothetical protein